MIAIFRGARGRVFILICLMFFVSYIDRVNISVAAPIMRKELHLTNTQLGFVLSAFGLCYATFQMINGFLGDCLGPRRMLSALGLLWSAGTLWTAASTGLASLVIGRAIVGLGEAGTIPTAARAMSNWVPPGDRGFAAGFSHTCARLAAVCTPMIVLGLIPFFGWRGAFAILGAVGLAWTAMWWVYFRDDPREHWGLNAHEVGHLPPYAGRIAIREVPLMRLLGRIFPVTFVFFCHAWTLWLYLTWLPSFFVGRYGLDLKDAALFTSAAFAAGMIGDAVGGVLTDRIYRQSGDLNRARRDMIVCGLLGSVLFISVIFVIRAPGAMAAALAAALFFLEMTEAPVWATTYQWDQRSSRSQNEIESFLKRKSSRFQSVRTSSSSSRTMGRPGFQPGTRPLCAAGSNH